jgi:hypothetical protein
MIEDLPLKVVRIIGDSSEVIACGANLRVARGAFDAAVQEYPRDKLELRNMGQVAARNWILKTVKATLMQPKNGAAPEMPGALVTDQTGKVVTRWEVTEPALRRLLDAKGFAFFEVEWLPGSDEWKIVQQVPDQE